MSADGTPAPDPRTRYVCTPQGRAEAARPRHALAPQVRRVLILAAGRRPLAELAQHVRPGEIEAAVALLVSLGLIEPTVRADPAPAVSPQRRLAALKRALHGVFEQALGHDGIVADARVRDSVDLPRLRRALRESIDQAGLRAGDATATELAQRVRRLLPGEPADPGAGEPGEPL